MSALVGPLLLSTDKDDDEISKLGALIRSFTVHLPKWVGCRVLPWLRDDNQVLLATLLYYTATHGVGVQTLGEELNLLVLHKGHRVPPAVIRVMYILLQALGSNKVFEMLCKVIPDTPAGHLVKHLKLPLSLITMHGGSLICQKLLGLRNHSLEIPTKIFPFYLIIICDVMYALVEFYKRRNKTITNIAATDRSMANSNGYLSECTNEYNSEHTAHGKCPEYSSERGADSPCCGIERTSIECSVCMDCIPVGQVATCPCGHVGCWECLNRAALVSNSCPVCEGPVFPLLALRNIRHSPEPS